MIPIALLYRGEPAHEATAGRGPGVPGIQGADVPARPAAFIATCKED
jgi:hypothetical protein